MRRNAQTRMAWGDPPEGSEQPWIIVFRDGSTKRVRAVSRKAALRGLRASDVQSCEPATLDLFAARNPRRGNDAGLDRKKLLREIAREQRAKERAEVVELRRKAKASKQSARSTCGSARTAAASARRAIKTLAKQSKVACGVAKVEAGARSAEARTRAAEIAAQRRSEAWNRRSARAQPRALARTRQSESDDEVRANIPPELLGLFERVKRQIRATPRKSRTEAFLEWVEEHPSERYGAIDDATDALVAQLEARQAMGNPKKRPSAHARYVGAVRKKKTARCARRVKRRAKHPYAACRPANPRAKPPSYREFHWGHGPSKTTVHTVPNPADNDALIVIGELPDIPYRTVKGVTRDTWEHVFSSPRPKLAYGNRDGKLYIIGGRYKIEARGIVG